MLPAGVYSIRKALELGKEYLLITSFLFIFALQQLTEGMLWLAMRRGNAEEIRLLATLFLSFSHFIWLILAPLAAALIESHPIKKKLFFVATVLGFTLGSSLYLPLLIYKKQLVVEVINHSIYYNLSLIYDGFISRDLLGLIYASIITLPMIFSSNGHIRNFGILLILTGIPAYYTYYNAFISVWCFFAGVVSLYIVYILARLSRHKRQV